MPRQHNLPHTSAPPGPCSAATTAYMDALEAATEANTVKKRALQELLDAMLEHSVPRVAVIDPKTGRAKWLEITEGEPRLRSRKAEAGELVESPADRRRRTGRADRAASVPGEPATALDDSDRTEQADQDENAATGSVAQESDPEPDLRTAGQQRRRGPR